MKHRGGSVRQGHMFIESFQGQYKDGTNGTHDFRMLSALFLVFRIVILFLFIIHLYTQGIQGVLLVCASGIHAITRPYKLNNVYNVTLVLLEILIFATSSYGSPLLTTLKTTYIIHITTLLLLIPHMILIFFIWHKLAKKTAITHCLKRKFITLKRCMQVTRPTSEAKADAEAESDTSSLPDRLINPEEYEPVLPTTEEHTAAAPAENEELDNEKL